MIQPSSEKIDATAPLSLRDVTVAYERKPVLWNVSLDVEAGSLVGLVGPNGAGKSTLLKAMVDMVPRISGEVRVFGQPYRACRNRVAYVPQRESVDWDFPATARDVVLMGTYGSLGWFRRVGAAQRAAATEALQKMEIEHLAQRQISQLSGGQQQRTFLARALVQHADLYLMDEPFAAVDASTERAIVSLMRELQTQGKTIIVVHHDLHTVPEYFDHLILLNMRLVGAGRTRDVFTENNLQKTYGGKLTLLEEVGEAMHVASEVANVPAFEIIGETSWESLWRLLTLQDYNTRVVLLGTVVIGLTSGLLGVYLLLRRRALIGDAISHAALPGVALAYLWTTAVGLEKSLPILLLGAAISGGLGGATVLLLRHLVKLREDASLGIVLSVFFGAGIALLSVAQRRGNAAGLEAFIYGKAASMTNDSVTLAIAVGLIVAAVLALLAKEFKLLCFDVELASSQGWPVLLLDSLLIGLVVAVTIVGLQAVGLILSIALLVVPAASARFWTHSLPKMLWISAAVGGFSCTLGTMLSASIDKLPSGATIVLVACSLFALSFAFGLQRGVVWRVTRMRELRREYNFQHLLRAAYEILESRGALPRSLSELKSSQPIPLADICKLRNWPMTWTRKLANRMMNVDLVAIANADAIQLTPRGVVKALASVRDHRLLEAYLVEQAEAKINEADREADYLEHGLQPEHLVELASLLDSEFRDLLPPSLHRISPTIDPPSQSREKEH